MKYVICAAALVLSPVLFAVSPMLTFAAENQPWAYPVAPKGAPKRDASKIVTVPGSEKKYNEVDINNAYGPPDWFPGDHPTMPSVVASGRQPEPRACSLCHLTTGDGHPESAGIAGLPAGYIVRTLQDFRDGRRTGARAPVMVAITKGMSDEDMKAAADYFSQIKPRPGYVKVIEAATVPKTYVGAGAMRFVSTGADAGMEPIGQRIITVPQDEDAAEARNPRVGFNHYVPPGSIKKGEDLVKIGGNGKTVPCAVCHGPNLKGLGEVPPLANRDLLYVVRQLNDMQNGVRSGTWVNLMKPVVEKLTLDDMIALAAYIGTLDP
ncbi:MAG TPA: cytochrome C [Xanthobacteraceae bacterium]|nr:cytochrome C [Xanthobacteraceae bacterium]